MDKTKKIGLIAVLAFALTLGSSAGLAQAALTLGANAVTDDGALTLTGGAASTWSTSVGALTVDSAAALNLGTSTATSIVLGKTGVGTTAYGITNTGALGSTGAATLTADAAATIPLSIAGYSGQSGNYLNITANGGAAGGVFKIASTGNITASGTLTGVTGVTIAATTNQLVLGTGSNLVTINSPAPTGGVTLTLPNTADTLVGRATTDTLTNKTLTAPAINGAVTTTGITIGTSALSINSAGVVNGHKVAALTPAATISLDPTTANIFTLVPGSAEQINAASVPVGEIIYLIITTSGTTTYNVTFGTNFKSTGVLATGGTDGKVFALTFVSNGTNFVEVSRTAAM